VSLRQRIRFYQQLAVLLRAGLPVRAGIERLRDRLGGREVAALAQHLAEGQRLGEAFAAAQFLPFESNLVGAGERSGQLETIFDHLAQFWQRDLEFRQALVSPLIYPIVVLHLAILLGCGVVLATQSWMVAAADFGEQILALYIILGLLYVVARVTWSSPAMKSFWLRVPIVGRALRAAFAYRWITSLRIEFGAGISLSRAIGDAWRASGFVDSERFAREGEEALRSGTSLTALVTTWRQLPRDWIDFFETGEVSGQFDETFRNLEAEAGRNWTLAQQHMSNWLPKILYFLALLVVAAQVVQVGKQVLIDPIEQVESTIDNAGK
jgi:type II secretory pathway component PulF